MWLKFDFFFKNLQKELNEYWDWKHDDACHIFWQNMRETCKDICYLSPATINDFTGLLFCAPHADMEKQTG